MSDTAEPNSDTGEDSSEGALPAGWMIVDSLTLALCLDEDGDQRFYIGSTESLAPWSAIGMCQLAEKIMSRAFMSRSGLFTDTDED